MRSFWQYLFVAAGASVRMVDLKTAALGFGLLWLLSRQSDSAAGRTQYVGPSVENGQMLEVRRVGDSFFGGVDYSLSVSGSIEPAENLESTDVFIDGSTVHGRMNDNSDFYTFDGEIVSAQIPNGVGVFVDGDRVI